MKNEKYWLDLYGKLDNEFKAGVILNLPTESLEAHLLTLCNVKNTADDSQARDRQRADMIRHLIQIRVTKSLYDRNWRMSVFALLVSIIALVVTVLLALAR